jgi:hypothetical protein
MTIPGFGITFYGATPTNTCAGSGPCYPTTDVAQQYDLLGGDAPAVPWNVVAWVNSGFSYALLHGDVPSKSIDDAIYQGTAGDTDYYLFTEERLPLLMPLEMAGVPGPLLAVVNAPAQVIVEWGYYRQPSPGEHVQFQLLPETDPITFLINLGTSFPVGIDDGLEEAGLGRALGTTPAGPYGVGGPTPPPDPNAPAALSAEPLSAAAAPEPEPVVTQASPPADTPEADPAPQGTEPENDAPEGNAAVQGTKPRPLRDLLRLPIQFDQSERTAARQNGDGPIRRALNALTGQRPRAEEPNDSAGEQQSGDQPAA